MKCRNIVAVISFLLVAVSCAREEGIILDGELNNEVQQSGQTELSLSFSININNVNVATRANEIVNNVGVESSVSDCSVILFEGENVVGAYDGVTATEDGNDGYTLDDAKFLVKTGRSYEVYVIGDTEQAFKACKTKTEVRTKAFGTDDLSSGVKFGSATVTVAEGSSSALEPEVVKETIDLKLSNLTAQIRLMDIVGDVREGEGSSDGTVQLTGVELLNQNTAYSIDGSVAMVLDDVASTSAFPFDIPNRDWDKTKETGISEFTTFPNNNGDNPVQIRLSFKVGTDEEQTRTYTINRPDGEEEGRTTDNKTETTYIHAGYIYNLYAKVALDGDDVTCELTCTTQDWLYNEYEVDVEEVKE